MLIIALVPRQEFQMMLSQSVITRIPWVVELHSPYLIPPLKVFLRDRVVMGRSLPGEAEKPDVDLSACDLDDPLISLRHLSLYCDGDDLMAMDMSSKCGSALNGRVMNPRIGYQLMHGDQLGLGKLELDVRVILSPANGGTVHYHPDLKLSDSSTPNQDQWILIVENDAEIAQVLTQLLQATGYTVTTARDVVSAMRTVSQKQPHGVILDLNLPDLDGMEFCRYVRREFFYNTMPILAINSGGAVYEISEVLEAGADLVMDRPLSAPYLRDMTLALVNQHESSPQGVSTRRLENPTPFNVFPPEKRRQGAVIYVADYDLDPIILKPHRSISFGRKPGVSSIGGETHIDLTRFDAMNLGVSRVHMYLHYLDGQFYIEDISSRNRTYLNGVPLRPFELIRVQNADEIRLGHLRMYIYLFEDGKPQ
jgi:DNA-binding response OmpR family regulator/pSer/pThr/pTyr-binding forkhead associated (FHA) protein